MNKTFNKKQKTSPKDESKIKVWFCSAGTMNILNVKRSEIIFFPFIRTISTITEQTLSELSQKCLINYSIKKHYKWHSPQSLVFPLLIHVPPYYDLFIHCTSMRRMKKNCIDEHCSPVHVTRTNECKQLFKL